MDFISEFMPPHVKTLLQDKAVISDLSIVLIEVEKIVTTAGQDSALDKPLKKALRDATTLLSAAGTYLKEGSLSYMQMAKLAYNKDTYKNSVKHLMSCFQAGDPAVTGVGKSIKENCEVIAAVKRIIPKTNGNLFRLELGENGQCYAVELLSGNTLRIPLSKEDYNEIQSALDAAKPPSAPPPKPPASPGI